METKSIQRLAEELTAAFEQGDLATIDRIYHPRFILWRNINDVEDDRAKGIQAVANLHKSFSRIVQKNLKRSYFDGGYVQQFVFSGVTFDGSTMEGPMCMVILVEDGRILRIDEYYDSAQDKRSQSASAPGP
jgi:ketosteroid isomerase-like protein